MDDPESQRSSAFNDMPLISADVDAQARMFKREYHRIHMEYTIFLHVFAPLVQLFWQRFHDEYADTREQIGVFVMLFEAHEKLKDDKIYPPTISIPEVSPNGDYVTILRDGDTWENAHYKMRKALEDRREKTREYFELMISFLFSADAVENKEFICDIYHGPLRILKHMLGQLHYE